MMADSEDSGCVALYFIIMCGRWACWELCFYILMWLFGIYHLNNDNILARKSPSGQIYCHFWHYMLVQSSLHKQQEFSKYIYHENQTKTWQNISQSLPVCIRWVHVIHVHCMMIEALVYGWHNEMGSCL